MNFVPDHLFKGHDFPELFRSRLAAVSPLSTQDGKWEADRFRPFGIVKVRRKVAAIIVPTCEQNLSKHWELWIADLDLSTLYVHEEVRDTLKDFLGASKRQDLLSPRGGYILEDQDGRLHLLVDEQRRDYLQRDLDDDSSETVGSWLDILNRYSISSIVGWKERVRKRGTRTTYDTVGVKVTDVNLLGAMRDDLHVRHFVATYYPMMTVSQFMRFRIIVQQAYRNQVPLIWDQVAKVVLENLPSL